ncbi:MAG: ATP-binding protein [archaeon]
MEDIKEITELLNPWWKENSINKELAKPYKRKSFAHIIDLTKYRNIIILSGLRRVGKTVLLYQVIEHLLKKIEPRHILYFNFDKRVKELTEILNKYEESTNINWKKEKVFVFLDEIVKLSEWADKIKLIYDAFPNIKFLISSSSSVRLEEEAIKNLAGRYFIVNIKPLSFIEYLELRGKSKFLDNINLWEKEIKKEFQNYLLKSFPEIIDWEDKPLIKDYLKSTIIDKVLKEDIPDRFKNVNKDLLLNLIEIFYSEPGMYIDYDGLSKKLRISKKTLVKHIFYLEFSYLINRIRNFRVNVFVASRKMQRIYANWWSLASCYSDNYDKIMENIVSSSINAKYYWRKEGKEIDFLIVDKKDIICIEVKNKNEITKNELKNMIYFLKRYNIKEGLVIYNGKYEEIIINNKKIKFIPLWKWLLESKF